MTRGITIMNAKSVADCIQDALGERLEALERAVSHIKSRCESGEGKENRNAIPTGYKDDMVGAVAIAVAGQRGLLENIVSRGVESAMEAHRGTVERAVEKAIERQFSAFENRLQALEDRLWPQGYQRNEKNNTQDPFATSIQPSSGVDQPQASQTLTTHLLTQSLPPCKTDQKEKLIGIDVDCDNPMQRTENTQVSDVDVTKRDGTTGSIRRENDDKGHTCAYDECTSVVEARGWFCEKHGGGRRCGFHGCNQSIPTDGSCSIHRLGKCIFQNCIRSVPIGKRCQAHQGTKLWLSDGCRHVGLVKFGLYCRRHVKDRSCKIQDCPGKTNQGSYCDNHCARRCAVKDCSKVARPMSPFCLTHGAGNRCSALCCNKPTGSNSKWCEQHLEKKPELY